MRAPARTLRTIAFTKKWLFRLSSLRSSEIQLEEALGNERPRQSGREGPRVVEAQGCERNVERVEGSGLQGSRRLSAAGN